MECVQIVDGSLIYRAGRDRLVPRELEGDNVREQVEISLVDKRQEDYVAPPPPAYTAFSGEGQTMG